MTAATIDLTAFDLADATDRLVLADLLADAGRDGEADLLRDEDMPVAVGADGVGVRLRFFLDGGETEFTGVLYPGHEWAGLDLSDDDWTPYQDAQPAIRRQIERGETGGGAMFITRDDSIEWFSWELCHAE